MRVPGNAWFSRQEFEYCWSLSDNLSDEAVKALNMFGKLQNICEILGIHVDIFGN